MLRPLEYKSMPIAELEEYISQIDSIVRKNYLLSSNSSFPSKNNSDITVLDDAFEYFIF